MYLSGFFFMNREFKRKLDMFFYAKVSKCTNFAQCLSKCLIPTYKLRIARIEKPMNKYCTSSNLFIYTKFKLESTVNIKINTLQLNVKHDENSSKFGHCFHSSSYNLFQENRDSKALALLNNVKQVRNSPVAALVLGFAGLIPFVAAPTYIISTGLYLPSVAYAQLAYGASILSFIGGVRWGLTLPQGSTQSPDWHNLGYSVMPSLIAWATLLASPTVGFLSVMGGLALTGYMDIAMWGYPNWFKGLRFCLTFVAILSLWTTFMCRFVLSLDQEKESTAATEKQKS